MSEFADGTSSHTLYCWGCDHAWTQRKAQKIHMSKPAPGPRFTKIGGEVQSCPQCKRADRVVPLDNINGTRLMAP